MTERANSPAHPLHQSKRRGGEGTWKGRDGNQSGGSLHVCGPIESFGRRNPKKTCKIKAQNRTIDQMVISEAQLPAEIRRKRQRGTRQ
jgi:hypothetical protein